MRRLIYWNQFSVGTDDHVDDDDSNIDYNVNIFFKDEDVTIAGADSLFGSVLAVIIIVLMIIYLIIALYKTFTKKKKINPIQAVYHAPLMI
uniref:Ac78-like protein n=1 Tax=Steinernema glaseri TaxID=37863 RepID=A0A1I7YN68_9BILA